MGANNLTTKNPGDVIASEDPNQYKSAADGNLVPRDTNGIPTSEAGSLGETLLRWFRLFVTKITLGDPDDEVHIEQTAGVMTMKINDIVKFILDANGFDGSKTSVSTRLKIQSQEFTSSGTFDMPAGITKVFVRAVGGGGGGGAGGVSGTNGGGGGGAGCQEIFTLLEGLTPSSPYTVTIGAGGAGGATNSNTSGANGGATSFGGVTVCLGGIGGTHGFSGNGFGGTGGAAYNQGGRGGDQVSISGTGGMQSEKFSGGSGGGGLGGGGGGGASSFGAGGNGGSGGVGSAAASTSYGAGGGGGGGIPSVVGYAGGAGADGYLQVIWFDHP